MCNLELLPINKDIEKDIVEIYQSQFSDISDESLEADETEMWDWVDEWHNVLAFFEGENFPSRRFASYVNNLLQFETKDIDYIFENFFPDKCGPITLATTSHNNRNNVDVIVYEQFSMIPYEYVPENFYFYVDQPIHLHSYSCCRNKPGVVNQMDMHHVFINEADAYHYIMNHVNIFFCSRCHCSKFEYTPSLIGCPACYNQIDNSYDNFNYRFDYDRLSLSDFEDLHYSIHQF